MSTPRKTRSPESMGMTGQSAEQQTARYVNKQHADDIQRVGSHQGYQQLRRRIKNRRKVLQKDRAYLTKNRDTLPAPLDAWYRMKLHLVDVEQELLRELKERYFTAAAQEAREAG